MPTWDRFEVEVEGNVGSKWPWFEYFLWWPILLVEDTLEDVCEDTDRAVAGTRRGDMGSMLVVGVVGERPGFAERLGREKF